MRLGLEINPFAIALGSLIVCIGLAGTISRGSPVFNAPDAFSALFYNRKLMAPRDGRSQARGCAL